MPHAKKEGIQAFLEEQQQGGGPVTLNRPDAPTAGKGNPLPEATFYRITAPAERDGQLTYNGITAGLPFLNGRAWTPDRELAFRLKWDFGYRVEIEEDPGQVKMVPIASQKPAAV
jgi:hypothetical protein